MQGEWHAKFLSYSHIELSTNRPIQHGLTQKIGTRYINALKPLTIQNEFASHVKQKHTPYYL
jgi:hypothetical protein